MSRISSNSRVQSFSTILKTSVPLRSCSRSCSICRRCASTIYMCPRCRKRLPARRDRALRRRLVEFPFDLGAGKVGVHHQPSFFLDVSSVPFFLRSLQMSVVGGTPHDGVIDRFSRFHRSKIGRLRWVVMPMVMASVVRGLPLAIASGYKTAREVHISSGRVPPSRTRKMLVISRFALVSGRPASSMQNTRFRWVPRSRATIDFFPFAEPPSLWIMSLVVLPSTNSFMETRPPALLQCGDRAMKGRFFNGITCPE
jgi:hypothetical protein